MHVPHPIPGGRLSLSHGNPCRGTVYATSGILLPPSACLAPLLYRRVCFFFLRFCRLWYTVRKPLGFGLYLVPFFPRMCVPYYERTSLSLLIALLPSRCPLSRFNRSVFCRKFSKRVSFRAKSLSGRASPTTRTTPSFSRGGRPSRRST